MNINYSSSVPKKSSKKSSSAAGLLFTTTLSISTFTFGFSISSYVGCCTNESFFSTTGSDTGTAVCCTGVGSYL